MFTCIDVSNVQGRIDWAAVVAHAKAAKINLVAAGIKGSEGVTFDDSLETTNVSAARAHGLGTFLYHYAHPHLNSPFAEADHMLRRIELVGIQRKDFRPFLDMEDPASLSMGHKLDTWTRDFNKRVRAKIGVWPGFYSYGDFIAHVSPVRPLGAALWYAHYDRNDGVEHPFTLPRPWRRRALVLHQFTSAAHWPGIRGTVDVSHGQVLRPFLAHPLGSGL